METSLQVGNVRVFNDILRWLAGEREKNERATSAELSDYDTHQQKLGKRYQSCKLDGWGKVTRGRSYRLWGCTQVLFG